MKHRMTPPTIVAAAPGFFVVEFSDDEEHVPLLTPIVAWHITVSSCVAVAITPDEHNEHSGIVYPDGRVVVPNFTTFENVEAFREYDAKRRKTVAEQERGGGL